MSPVDYDAWYESPRGRWIGETEYWLLVRLLTPRPGDRVLDVGCGTGWFTRKFARLPGLSVSGIDLSFSWLSFARSRDPHSSYIQADARGLPFADSCFECVLSVAALCFVPDWARALGEILRVSRHRFAVGLLNRNGLLWRKKGRDGGQGSYRGAHWHTRRELLRALSKLPARNVRVRTAVFFPDGSPVSRQIERGIPGIVPFGSFIAVSGEK